MKTRPNSRVSPFLVAFSIATVSVGIALGSVALPQVAGSPIELEGPLIAVDALTGTANIMGITVDLTQATISGPTSGLTIADLVGAPFPARGGQAGFIGGTAIVIGVDIGGIVLADTVFAEPAEHVLVGPVTSNSPGGGLSGQLITVLGIELREIGDPRMPFTASFAGLPVDLTTVVPGTLAGAEGYMGTDGILYVHTLEAEGGVIVGGAQVTINKSRCKNNKELQVRGVSTDPGSIDLTDEFGAFLGSGQAIVDVPGAPAEFKIKVPIGSCPDSVTATHAVNGASDTATL